jgi:hypothetical protein
MHNIDYQEFGENTVIPLHGGSYFVRRPLDTDPRTFNGDRDAAWRMDVSDAFAETLQRHEYQPHRLTFGERLVIHFGINGDFYTGILLGGVVVSLVICAAATLIAHVRLG